MFLSSSDQLFNLPSEDSIYTVIIAADGTNTSWLFLDHDVVVCNRLEPGVGDYGG